MIDQLATTEHTPWTADEWAARWRQEADARNALFQENLALKKQVEAMQAVIQVAFTALDECYEDTCELSAERDWWKTEPRCGYSERWAQMQVRITKAVAALAALKPFLPTKNPLPAESVTQ